MGLYSKLQKNEETCFPCPYDSRYEFVWISQETEPAIWFENNPLNYSQRHEHMNNAEGGLRRWIWNRIEVIAEWRTN